MRYSEDERYRAEIESFYATHSQAFDRSRMSSSTRYSIDSVSDLEETLQRIEGLGQWSHGLSQASPDLREFWNSYQRAEYRESIGGINIGAAWNYLAELDQLAERWGLDRVHINRNSEGRETLHRWFLARVDNRPILEAGEEDRPARAEDFWRFLPVYYTGPATVPPELRIGGETLAWWPEVELRRDARKRLLAATSGTLSVSAIEDYLDHVINWYEGRKFTRPQTEPQLERDICLLYRRLAYRENPEVIWGNFYEYVEEDDDSARRNPVPFRDDQLTARDIRNRVNDLARDIELDLPLSRTIPH